MLVTPEGGRQKVGLGVYGELHCIPYCRKIIKTFHPASHSNRKAYPTSLRDHRPKPQTPHPASAHYTALYNITRRGPQASKSHSFFISVVLQYIANKLAIAL